jgi:putative oxidoreductase
MSETLSAWTPRVLSILRIVAAALMTSHGSNKLFDIPHSDFRLPLLSLWGFLGLCEFVGGAALLLGLFARPAALGLSALMAADYLWVFTRQGWLPWSNGGEYVVLYTVIFLYLAFAGPGPSRRISSMHLAVPASAPVFTP